MHPGLQSQSTLYKMCIIPMRGHVLYSEQVMFWLPFKNTLKPFSLCQYNSYTNKRNACWDRMWFFLMKIYASQYIIDIHVFIFPCFLFSWLCIKNFTFLDWLLMSDNWWTRSVISFRLDYHICLQSLYTFNYVHSSWVI